MMNSGSLPHLEQAFASVGWFIPPYIAVGFLSKLGGEITSKGSQFTQDDLQIRLGLLYESGNLAAMVKSRYPITPVICDYKDTIAEAIEAHFLGLHHVAVGGLVPVIEGAGRELIRRRGLPHPKEYYIKDVFKDLANDCKSESINRGIGKTDEIISMMDSFSRFTTENLYADSRKYNFLDKTNRNGITHGSYTDKDYGQPINFYKIIGAVNFLCFVSAFRENISWFSPESTEESTRLAQYYQVLQVIAHGRDTSQVRNCKSS